MLTIIQGIVVKIRTLKQTKTKEIGKRCFFTESELKQWLIIFTTYITHTRPVFTKVFSFRIKIRLKFQSE